MDRASRFQNPIPLSFSKAVQNDIVSSKSPPSSLLDRFRALVKEREEEARVFGGGLTVMPLSTDEIVRLYGAVLSELTINSKPIITDLTVIAGEQRAHAKGIAGAICSRIVEVSVDKKLPSLYLLDSIVKNIGKDYIKYFSAHLPEVFCEAYAQVHPNMHRAMRHLFGTWSSVFPSSLLRQIEAQLQFSPSVHGQPSGLNSSRASESPRPTHGIHINPKYLGAQQQFGRSPLDGVKTEDVSANERAGQTSFGLDAANRPVHSASGITKSSPNSSVARKYDSHVDLQGPRALISAYGIDEREKHLHNKHLTAKQVDSTRTDESLPTRTWQNTEEEEFDWKDMAPALGEQRQSNYSSSLPPLGKSLSGYGSFNKDAGVMPNVSGLNDSTGLVSSGFAGELLISQHQHSQSYLKSKIPHNLPLHASVTSQMLTNGQFGINSSVNIINDQGLSKPLHSEPHLSSTQGMAQVNLSPYPNQLRGPVPLNLHGVRPTTSHAIAASPMSHGYIAPGPVPTGSTSNAVPPFQSSLPVINALGISYHRPGTAWQSLPQASFPGPSQSLPVGQNTGQAVPNPPSGGALCGLIGSLMAQGLISLTKQDSMGVEFDQDMLKVRCESAISSLYGDIPRQCTSCGLRFRSQEDHSTHMDWHVNKNRTLRNRKTKPSPKWFVNVSMWLSGAEAFGTEAVPGFLSAENIVEKPDDDEAAVPADEDQNTCALCGECFDDFYSDELEEWMYKGAVYMYAPVGSALGMDRSQLGPIVHAKCRSDSSHVNPPEETRTDEWELPEEVNQRKRIRS